MFINRAENVEERHNITVSNTSYCAGITQENQNCIHKYIEDQLNLGETCCH